ncbi:Antifungal protein ginkbilobin-2, partial [Cucurbita argyrosperma subsp. argyrosperma]
MVGCSLKISAAFLALFGFFAMVVSVPNTGVKSVLCNSGIFTGGDPFAVSLDYVLKELESSTPTTNNYDFYNISPYPNSFAYGHASCNQSLTTSDCTTCLGAAKTNMLGSCQMRIGARAVLNDCSIRYEQNPFDD